MCSLSLSIAPTRSLFNKIVVLSPFIHFTLNCDSYLQPNECIFTNNAHHDEVLARYASTFAFNMLWIAYNTMPIFNWHSAFRFEIHFKMFTTKFEFITQNRKMANSELLWQLFVYYAQFVRKMCVKVVHWVRFCVVPHPIIRSIKNAHFLHRNRKAPQ